MTKKKKSSCRRNAAQKLTQTRRCLRRDRRWLQCSAVGSHESISWNCRGLGNPRSVRALQDLVRRYNPKVVFLMETKAKNRRMERIRNRLGFANGLCVPCVGRSGGLALIWNREVDIEIKSFSKNHIDAVVKEQGSNSCWRLTGFYGHPETHRRYESWQLLAFLNSQFQLPWLCLGDFNEILSITEKEGGAIRTQQQMDGFRRVINFCNFQDLGYCGADYTWSNMQEGNNCISLRLDRALATPDWVEKFGNLKVFHIADSTSDHHALLVTESLSNRYSREKRFHFEAMWAKNNDCKAVIESSWGMGFDLNTPEGIVENIKRCAADLRTWSSQVYGQISKKIQDKRNALNNLTRYNKDGVFSNEINCLKREINILLDDEELYWG